MMRKDEHIELTDKLTMSKMPNGFWLYDKTIGMNLSMRAKTKEIAFVEAITYYQNRLKEVESELKKLDDAIHYFNKSISDDNNEDNEY